MLVTTVQLLVGPGRFKKTEQDFELHFYKPVLHTVTVARRQEINPGEGGNRSKARASNFTLNSSLHGPRGTRPMKDRGYIDWVGWVL